MPAQGKHRRPKSSSINRGVVAAGTGGIALALPLIGTSVAQAAEQPAPATSTEKADGAASAPAAAKAATKTEGKTEGKTKTKTYSVVVGDSLSKVADDHSLRGGWEKLYEDNQKAVGDDPRLIHPGLKLTIGKKSEAKPEGKTEAPAKKASAKAAPAAEAPAAYANNLDGWIKESLAIMAKEGIPGSYEGIHRNIMRESGGNPQAINNWDVNAVNGTPSKGLLQVIAPTFQAYHVPGTSSDSYDPVANITAACNYAADRYGSIDNVNGPY